MCFTHDKDLSNQYSVSVKNIEQICQKLFNFLSKVIESLGNFMRLPPLSHVPPPRRQHICLEWPKAENERRYCKTLNSYIAERDIVDIFLLACLKWRKLLRQKNLLEAASRRLPAK